MTGSPDSPRVLFVKSWGPGDVRTSKEIEALNQAGYKVRFLGWYRDEETAKADDRCVDVQMMRLPVGFSNWKVLPGYLAWMAFVFVHVLVSDADVVHAVDFESGGAAILATLVRRRPFVYDVYDSFHLRHDYPWLLEVLLRRWNLFVMARSDLVVRVDERRISAAEQQFEEKTIVVMNTPPDLLNDRSEPVDNDPDTVVLALAGLLQRGRGVEWILDTIETRDDAEFLAIGPVWTDGLKQELERASNVTYHPLMSQEDALSECRRADLIMAVYDPSTPLYRKASPNKLFDAMMLGIPVVVNEELEIATLVEDEGIGYTLPYGDVAALESLIERIQVNPSESHQRGHRGRELYEERYTWDRMAKRLLDEYEGLLEQPTEES